MIIPGITASKPPPPDIEESPLPGNFPNQAQMRYWFSADANAYSDDAGTKLAKEGEGVARWGNRGTSDPAATQTNAANRPIFRTNGQGGRPYLECNGADQHFFDDLPSYDWGSGTTNFSGWQTMAAVFEIEENPVNAMPIFGAAGTGYTKADHYFYSDRRLRCWKDQWVLPAFAANTPSFYIAANDGTCSWRYTKDSTSAVDGSSCTNANSSAVSNTQFLRKASVGLYFTGKLYELIVWNGAGEMSAGNQAIVADYFKTKYGI